MPVVTRIASPFAISHHKRFTVLNPIPAPSACYETALYLLCRPYGTRFHFSTHPALTRLLRTSVVPYGDSDLFPTLPSAPPAAPCWAKLFRLCGARSCLQPRN